MRFPDPSDTTPSSRVSLADRVLGGFGAAMIATTLFGARLWARVTRTPYHRH